MGKLGGKGFKRCNGYTMKISMLTVKGYPGVAVVLKIVIYYELLVDSIPDTSFKALTFGSDENGQSNNSSYVFRDTHSVEFLNELQSH